MSKPLVFYDFETTGLDTSKDRIVQFAFIKYVSSDEIHELVSYVNPEMKVSPEALEIHGITDEVLAGYPTLKEFAEEILAFIEGCDMVGFNSNNFDLPMMHEEFSRIGVAWHHTRHRHIDAGNIYKRMRPRTLTAAYAEFVGGEIEGAHDAGDDTRALMNVFLGMVKAGIKNDDGEILAKLSDLEKYSAYDKCMVDIAGKFYYDEDRKICFGFGKHTGEVVNTGKHYGFLKWMLSGNFPTHTKSVVKYLMNPRSN